MTDTTIWVVSASQGEYSDRTEWVVEAHTTEEAGKAAVDKLDEAERIANAGRARYTYEKRSYYLSDIPLKGAADAPS